MLSRANVDQSRSSLRELLEESGKITIGNAIMFIESTDMNEIKYLGNGNFGTVTHQKISWKGKHYNLAVKEMTSNIDSEILKRILMDLRVSKLAVGCDHIVKTYGYIVNYQESCDLIHGFICMELMETSLGQIIESQHLAIEENIIGMINWCTIRQLIHRDVKPSNILMNAFGAVKLCDFGMVGRLIDSKATSQAMATLVYMAPERIDQSQSTYDSRADIWSLGITLIQLASGRIPFYDNQEQLPNILEIYILITEKPPPKLKDLVKNRRFSEKFCDFTEKCLKKDFQERPKYSQLMEHEFYVENNADKGILSKWYWSIKNKK